MTGLMWTRARVERVMCLRFGFAQDQTSPDTAAAAAAMGVTRRTVQRWLHANHGRSIAHIPARRREQLIDLLRPDEETLAREDQQARYALKSIDGLRLPRRMGVKPSWEKQRWLEPHRVVVLEIPVRHLKIRQLTITRDDPARTSDLERRGKIVDEAIVPTRFHATVLVHDTLEQLHEWRFQAGTDQVVQGYSQAWIADSTTPKTHLRTSAALIAKNHHHSGRRQPVGA